MVAGLEAVSFSFGCIIYTRKIYRPAVTALTNQFHGEDPAVMKKQKNEGYIECDYCGELFVEGEPYCPYCGKPVEEIIKAWEEKGNK